MKGFIPINREKIQENGIDLSALGKAEGFLGLGRKVYLVYDEKQGWGVCRLNIIDRIIRFCTGKKGLFANTVKANVLNEMNDPAKQQQLTKVIAEAYPGFGGALMDIVLNCVNRVFDKELNFHRPEGESYKE